MELDDSAERISNLDALDENVQYSATTGMYHNSRLNASNVWLIDVDTAIIREVAMLFERCKLRDAHDRLDFTDRWSHARVTGEGGESFFAQHAAWASDVAWMSTDDQLTHDAFLSIFTRLNLPQRFRDVIGDEDGGVHMFSAFFVVRRSCTKPDLHVDYGDGVGTKALTLMTPLYKEYEDVPDFQLLYTDNGEGVEPPKLRRYRYRLGQAIVFGSAFAHSTEPGTAAAGQGAHAYLCFAFGSNRAEHWPIIAETVDGNQARQISRPSQPGGATLLTLSKLGRKLEEGCKLDDGANATTDAGGQDMSPPRAQPVRRRRRRLA